MGKTIQITIPTIGAKSLTVKVSIKDPSGKSYTIATIRVAKNKPVITPNVKFAKPGTYVVTIAVGATKKVVTVRVS